VSCAFFVRRFNHRAHLLIPRLRLGEANNRYVSDTTGRYVALRQINDEADAEIRTDLNNPEALP
jgi:hypothetical protein